MAFTTELGEKGEGWGTWTRQVNLKDSQIAALQREIANLRAHSLTSLVSTVTIKDDY